ncbi:probable 3-hydroxyisobutyrate dehydrogenase, mitochondrial isoform X4 [Magnolia sinica]|nr:probable 3-hydroxyisobutyrate dehydrogenase, mitochondrial isoform X4 [Magnolia sinica]
MGFHMANNLVNAGFKVVVHDINRNATKKFSDKGVPTKETPLEVAESSDVIITMLPSSSHVLDVYTGANGLLHGENLLRPWLLIDSSTVDPHTSRRLSESISKCVLKEKKVSYLQMLDWSPKLHPGLSCKSQANKGKRHPGYVGCSCVWRCSWCRGWDSYIHGGTHHVDDLNKPVGGLEEAYLAARPLFLSMGKRAIYCGGTGNGAAAKICNNIAMAVSMLGVSEAFALGQSLGITASTLTNIFNSSSACCWSSDTYNPVPGVMDGVPSSRNYVGGFSSKLMAKDLELAAVSAEEVGLKCPFSSQAREIYAKLCEEGHEYEDFSCAFRHYYSGKDERSPP